ncbi:pyridoxal-phosphate dependent enzyme [Streptomyces bikiniensis]|uniref:Pyridoxal-phosphate dependent enzyme n=1 Tax=Streptomyces bikiniensis TaxID=1896 RepID=A0ABW8D1D5_STRBI
MLFTSMVDAIGHTPLVQLRHEAATGVGVYAKLELQNPFAMKDRVARNIILQARRTGTLAEGAPIVESSSGTMALGVALVGTTLGHPVHIVTDPRIDPVTLAKLRALGCHVRVVEAMTSQGWQSARLEELERLMSRLPNAFWPQQYENPDNPGSYRSLAAELLDDLGSFDVLVGAVGSGGSLCGTARALRETLPGLKVVGVDAVGSMLFGQPDQPTRLQSGLGNSLLPKNLDRRSIDEVHWLNDREAFESTRALAREQQIFAGNTSGSVYRVLGHLASNLPAGSRIVGIFPDRGDRYVDTVYSDEHWQQKGVVALPTSPIPKSVAPKQTVSQWAMSRPIEKEDLPSQHLVFVESNTTGSGMLALTSARKLGYMPVLLTGKAERYAGLAETGSEVLVCDTNSQQALRAALQKRFRHEELAGITTTSDFYVPAVADLTTWLGLPGNPVEAVATCRNKALLREHLHAAGVGQPRFVAVRDTTEVADAVSAVGLPCVVKPADDSGSNNVLLCTTQDEVRFQVETILAIHTNLRGMATARTVLVEEYVDAPEFSVELFHWQGQGTSLGITQKYVTGPPYFVEYQHVFPASLSPSDEALLTNAALQAVGSTGIRTGPTHTEIRLTKGGPKIIEVNPRLAGGMIPELIRLATGTSLLEEQLRAAAGHEPRLSSEPQLCAGIRFLLPEQEGKVLRVDGTSAARKIPGVQDMVITTGRGASARPVRNAYDRLGFVIATGHAHEQVTKSCAEALLQIDVVLSDDHMYERPTQ